MVFAEKESFTQCQASKVLCEWFEESALRYLVWGAERSTLLSGVQNTALCLAWGAERSTLLSGVQNAALCLAWGAERSTVFSMGCRTQHCF